MKKLAFAFIICTFVALLLVGCGKGSEKEKSLHIGYFNNITHAQALYLKAERKLEERMGQGTKVSWTSFNAGPSEVEALLAGDIDIGYIGPVPAITANSRSQGNVTVLSGSAQAGAVLVVHENSGITSVEDLDGKIVAIPQMGNTQHLCLLKILEDHKLKTVEAGGTITVTAVENAEVQNMMEQGKIDAALVPEPWGSLLEVGGARILLDYDEVYQNGDYPVTVVVVRNDYLKDYPEMVEAFMEEHEAVTAYLNQNISEGSRIVNGEINKDTGKNLKDAILNEAFKRIQFSTKINRESMEEFGKLALKDGFIEERREDLYTEK